MGAGNASANAQRQAQASEAARQQSIAQSTAAIDRVYNAPERQAQYSDFVGALRRNYTDDANRQQTSADRQRRFSMARSGLVGGSADVDSRRQLGEEYQRGLLTAEDRAQSALGDLKSQDNAARLNLTQLAQGGLDATTAASRAGAQIQASAQQARGSAVANGLGDIFGATAATYKKQQEAAAFRRGQTSPVGSLYGAQAWS